MVALSVTLPAVVALRVLDTPRIDGLAAFVQRFPNLHRLELVNLPLTELPQGLENLHRLSHLNLSRTRLTPTRLAELGTLSGLQTLILNDIDVPDFSWTAQHMTRLLTRDSLRILTLQGSSARFEQGVFAALQQATHLHPAQGRQAQLVDQLRGAIAGRHQIQFQLHLALGTGNGGKHAREELRTVEQQLEAVTAAPGKDHQRALKISTALTGTARLMAGKPARARRLSRPSARPKSAAFSTSGARVTT